MKRGYASISEVFLKTLFVLAPAMLMVVGLPKGDGSFHDPLADWQVRPFFRRL